MVRRTSDFAQQIAHVGPAWAPHPACGRLHPKTQLVFPINPINCFLFSEPGTLSTPSTDGVNGVSGTATDIAAGSSHSCAIQAGTGEVVCWGYDYHGQATPPDNVNGVSGTATGITVGSHHSCAIQAGTDEVVCWGDDAYGQATPPDAVNGVRGTASDISAGQDYTLAIVEPTGWLAQSAGLALLCALGRRRTRKRGGRTSPIARSNGH